MENLVKINIELYLPALIDLIDFSDFPWNKINRLFSTEIDKRILKSSGKNMLIEASIYDVIIEAKKHNRKAIGLLDFLNKVFEELTDTLTTDEKVLIRANAKSMLKAFDSKYLNFVSEMAVLNNMIKSGNYRLKGIEAKLSNGKSVDFKLIDVATNNLLLVEIVNIHLDAVRVQNDSIAIQKFLTHKLVSKMYDKKNGLVNNDIIYLVPVLWGGWQEIKIYSDFYKSNQINIPQVLEPVAYLQYNDDQDYFVHHFKTVSHLFKFD